MLFAKSELLKRLKLGNLKNMKKDQFLIILLSGLLLLIIGIPTKEQSEEAKGDKQTSFFSEDENGLKREDGMDVGLQTEQQQVNQQTEEVTMNDAREYIEALEEKLEETLSYIEGAGRVKVIVTIKSGVSQTIDKDTTDVHISNVESDAAGGSRTTVESETAKETVYLSDADGVTRPYVIHETVPEVEGVVVISEGGNSEVVKSEITKAMQALFPLEAHKIRVIRMQRNNSIIEGDDRVK